MTDVFEVAAWVSRELDDLGFDHCIIGGVALQIWGEAAAAWVEGWRGVEPMARALG